MALVGALFYGLPGFPPRFARACINGVYRDNETRMRDSAAQALRNGIAAAASPQSPEGPGRPRKAMCRNTRSTTPCGTNPEAVAHFQATSAMDRQSLEVMAQGLAGGVT